MPSPSKPLQSGFNSPQKHQKLSPTPNVKSPKNRESEGEDLKLLESTDYKKASIMNPLPSLKSKNLRQDEPQINLSNQAKKQGATKGVQMAGYDRSKTPFLQIQKFGQLNKLESKKLHDGGIDFIESPIEPEPESSESSG